MLSSMMNFSTALLLFTEVSKIFILIFALELKRKMNEDSLSVMSESVRSVERPVSAITRLSGSQVSGERVPSYPKVDRMTLYSFAHQIHLSKNVILTYMQRV